MPLGFADAIFRRERSDDRKCVCASQAIAGPHQLSNPLYNLLDQITIIIIIIINSMMIIIMKMMMVMMSVMMTMMMMMMMMMMMIMIIPSYRWHPNSGTVHS